MSVITRLTCNNPSLNVWCCAVDCDNLHETFVCSWCSFSHFNYWITGMFWLPHKQAMCKWSNDFTANLSHHPNQHCRAPYLPLASVICPQTSLICLKSLIAPKLPLCTPNLCYLPQTFLLKLTYLCQHSLFAPTTGILIPLIISTQLSLWEPWGHMYVVCLLIDCNCASVNEMWKYLYDRRSLCIILWAGTINEQWLIHTCGELTESNKSTRTNNRIKPIAIPVQNEKGPLVSVV